MGLLSLAIWLPIVIGILLLALGREGQARSVRWIALIGSIASFLVTLPLYDGFVLGTSAMQFVEKSSWVQRFSMNYHIGVDGISLWLVLLTAFINVVVIIASWESITTRVNQYMASFMILSGLMIGVFAALDGMLFYVFFEATLIPMYLIIGIWGGPNKIYAAFKFFLYTLLGSLLMLVAIVFLYNKSGGSFDIFTWHQLALGGTAQTLLFFAFFAAFAVKVPMWPFHTWLPDVHVEAPAGGSAVLAAIMLKLGAYGFLRFSLPIAPDASREWAWLIIALSLIAVIYVGLVALVQRDMKKLVAYASVAHMGFVTLGFFLFSELGVAGGIVQMISHGFVSAAMFLCIGVLYDRVHSREISSYGGVVNRMPKFSAFALLFAMANCGLPGTAGFVGEWMVILAAVQSNFWIGGAAATALISSAAYTLWMYKRVHLGPVVNDEVNAMLDINKREFVMLSLLAIGVLFMGIYPKPFTDVMNTSVADLLQHVALSKLN
ncbi:NADH-quinone oxidoreductase subunit M [Polaromonas sp.]|nr:NADH-quinone oxidoreductase subunit M [Polaromonas sp.]